VTGRGLLPEYVIPKHLFGANLTHRYKSFTVNLDLDHNGSYLSLVFEDNLPFRRADLRFPGYTKADLFASFEKRFFEKITATFFSGADNLFQPRVFREWVPSAGDSPPRRGELQVLISGSGCKVRKSRAQLRQLTEFLLAT
jgi:hypothetical protein